MRQPIGCVIVAALMAVATAAGAQDDQRSIGKAREYCAEWDKTDFAEVEQPFYAGYCLGLIQAFRDGMTFGIASTLAFFDEKAVRSGAGQSTGYQRWCIPSDVTNQQLAGAFMAWSSHKQDYWHLPYALGLYEAFKEEWPCPGGGAPEGPAAGK